MLFASGHVSSKTRPKISTALAQAKLLQSLVFADAKDNPDPTIRARLIAAWDTLEERKRLLRMKPLPGSLRPEQARRKPAKEQVSFAPAPASDPSKPE